MGIAENKALVYDGIKPLNQVPLDELAARWDGVGLLLSDTPIEVGQLWLAVTFQWLFYGAVVSFMFTLLWTWRRRLNGTPGGVWAKGFRNAIRQAAVLAVTTALLAGTFYFVGEETVLKNRTAIKDIQDAHLMTFYPKVDSRAAERLMSDPEVTVIDARPTNAYEDGHLPGAINIPPNSTSEECAEKAKAISPTNRILLYCHGRGCVHSEQVMRLLIDQGFERFVNFEGGWVEWSAALGGLSDTREKTKGSP